MATMKAEKTYIPTTSQEFKLSLKVEKNCFSIFPDYVELFLPLCKHISSSVTFAGFSEFPDKWTEKAHVMQKQVHAITRVYVSCVTIYNKQHVSNN